MRYLERNTCISSFYLLWTDGQLPSLWDYCIDIKQQPGGALRGTRASIVATHLKLFTTKAIAVGKRTQSSSSVYDLELEGGWCVFIHGEVGFRDLIETSDIKITTASSVVGVFPLLCACCMQQRVYISNTRVLEKGIKLASKVVS